MKIFDYSPDGSLFGELLISLGRKGSDELLRLLEATESHFSAVPAIDTVELRSCFEGCPTTIEILGVDECVAFPVSNPWCRNVQFAVVPKNFFENVRKFIDETIVD